MRIAQRPYCASHSNSANSLEEILTHIFVPIIAMHAFYTLVREILTRIVEFGTLFPGHLQISFWSALSELVKFVVWRTTKRPPVISARHPPCLACSPECQPASRSSPQTMIWGSVGRNTINDVVYKFLWDGCSLHGSLADQIC